MIQVNDLVKHYVTYKRGHTFKETLKSLFMREKVLVEALKGISFNVDKGELVGFIGPNGAGKSTTMKILTGVLHPSQGQVSIMDYVPWKDRTRYVSNIGAVFGQKSQLIWDIPPIDAFHMNKAIYAIPESFFKKRLDLMVELLQVEKLITKPTRQLSLGERMKCEFIMSMLHNPKVVFLDEPTIGLDVIARDTIRDFIKSMNEQGVTFILTTHDMGDIEHLAKRVIVINYGEIVFDGNMENLKTFFGAKKRITVKTENEAILPTDRGIEIVTSPSKHEINIELDTELLSVNNFITHVNKNNIIHDLTINELPIERVIKHLYTSKVRV